MIRINSIYPSISGEVGYFPQGSWCTIIRLQGCNMICKYCDAMDANPTTGGIEMTEEEIFNKVDTKNVLITGGEPLCQSKTLCDLISALKLQKHCNIQVETNGSIPIPNHIKDLATWVVDYKNLSSGTNEFMGKENLDFCRRFENVFKINKLILKFVISDENDMNKALDVIETMERSFNYKQRSKSTGIYAFSPVDAKTDLAKMIIDKLEKRIKWLMDDGRIVISLQIHKFLNFA